MDDVPGLIFAPLLRLLYALLQGLLWLGWEVGVETIGWGIGWAFCRLCTLGQLPKEGLGEQEQCNPFSALAIELLGLLLLAAAVWLLATLLGGPPPTL